MNEPNIPTAAPEQNAPAATEPTAPQTAAEEIVTVGALRGAIERRQEQRTRRAAEEAAARWSREADELTAQCPDFDLGAALKDTQFCALLRAGVDVRTPGMPWMKSRDCSVRSRRTDSPCCRPTGSRDGRPWP